MLLGVWQLACIAWKVPVYLVPSPADIGRTLAADGPMLLGALWMTLKITFLSF
ncbi:ABC transporter ATP-binding protein, partial [Enterococcus faecium]